MKIVFTGGGTAGHVTPNIALIQILHKNADCFYVGTDGMEKAMMAPLIGKEIRAYREISAGKLQRKWTADNLALPFRLAKSVKQAKKILRDIRPDVVFGKGGYVALPVMLAAHRLRIPTVIHESDRSLGLANRICSHFCTELLTAFPCRKGKTVGAILRREITTGNRKKGLKIVGFDGKKPVLLVVGGSSGARELNDLVQNSKQLAETFDVFVISGKGKTFDCDFAHQQPFVTDIGDVYACADVALTRGGSNSLAELTAANVPFAVLPLTKATRGEQSKNAEYFTEKNCGILLQDPTPASLCSALRTLHDNKNFYRAAQKKLQMDGTEKVAEILLQTTKK